MHVPPRVLVIGVPARVKRSLTDEELAPDVTLMKGDLHGIVRARRLSAATMSNIRQNLFFAFIYNALGVPIAAGVLYPFIGLLLNPDDRRGGDELQFRVGHRECAAAATIRSMSGSTHGDVFSLMLERTTTVRRSFGTRELNARKPAPAPP